MKTEFEGTNNDYKKVLGLIEEALEILYGTGHSINDMCYFGIDVEVKNREEMIYENIEKKLKEVKVILTETIRR